MENNICKRVKITDIIAVCCIYFASIASLNEGLNSIALYIALPIATILCFLSYDTIRQNRYVRILLILYLWLCVCTGFAVNTSVALIELKRVLGCFMLSFCMASLANKPRLIPWLYGIYCVLLIFSWKYASENILTTIEFGEERLNDDKLNANTLAYYTFYTTVCIYTLGEILHGLWRKIFRILLFGMIVVAFFTSIFTASRQVLIIHIPLFAILLWVRYFRGVKVSNIVPTFVLVISCLCIILPIAIDYIEPIYENSFLKERNEIEVKDDDRMVIVQEVIEKIPSKPIFGHGPGNARFYTSSGCMTHNTFLELGMNSGFPGILIFAHLILLNIRTQYRRWKITKDQFFLFLLIFTLFWLFYQMFYVFYFDMWLMSFFILVATHSNTHFKYSQVLSAK